MDKIHARIQESVYTKAEWEAANPVLLKGEKGFVSDDPNLFKIGDGVTAWNSLPWRGYTGTIAQVTGDNENAVMSQKATVAAIQAEAQERNEADKQLNTAIEAEKNRAEAAEKAIIYDVSVNNNGAVFESLQALLSSSNLSTLIPTSVRHGGVTIRFIQGSEQGSDNKYVQFRLMSNVWSTTVADWQGVDDKPIAGSNNLVKSGGVSDKLAELEEEVDSFHEVLDNPEFVKVEVDGSGNILSSIDADGNKTENLPTDFTDELKHKGKSVLTEHQDISYLATKEELNVSKEHQKTINLEIGNKINNLEDKVQERYSKEYKSVVVDADDKVISAIDNEDIEHTSLEQIFHAPVTFEDNVSAPFIEDIKELQNHVNSVYERNDLSIGTSLLGNLQIQENEDADYCVIMMYGQSLSIGDETSGAIEDEPVEDCYMLGDSVRNTNGTELKPLSFGTPDSRGIVTGVFNNPVIAAVKSYVKMYKTARPRSKTKFIAISLGISGASIAQLSSAARYPLCNQHYLDTRVSQCFRALKEIADRESKTIGLSSVMWLQGEADYGVPYISKTYDEWKTLAEENISARPNMEMRGSKDAYYHALKYLKEDIESLAIEKFGQSKKPIFMAYCTAGTFINNAYMTINSATMQLADDTDNMFLMSPTYQTPDFKGGHLTMNGYRWYGEYCAKALFNIFVMRQKWSVVRPTHFEVVNGNKILIYFSNTVRPLVFDEYTVGNGFKNKGFTVRSSTASELDSWTTNKGTGKSLFKTITDIRIVNGNCVEITTKQALGPVVEIIYGGQGEEGYDESNQGGGNLRDSDEWHSLYTYKDDTDEKSEVGSDISYRPKKKDGSSLIGAYYPMQNWCVNFYKRIIL